MLDVGMGGDGGVRLLSFLFKVPSTALTGWQMIGDDDDVVAAAMLAPDFAASKGLTVTASAAGIFCCFDEEGKLVEAVEDGVAVTSPTGCCCCCCCC